MAEDFPEIDISVTNDPIDLLLNDHKVVFTSNGTSAAVDAYCLNKHIITVLDPDNLNYWGKYTKSLKVVKKRRKDTK